MKIQPKAEAASLKPLPWIWPHIIAMAAMLGVYVAAFYVFVAVRCTRYGGEDDSSLGADLVYFLQCMYQPDGWTIMSFVYLLLPASIFILPMSVVVAYFAGSQRYKRALWVAAAQIVVLGIIFARFGP